MIVSQRDQSVKCGPFALSYSGMRGRHFCGMLAGCWLASEVLGPKCQLGLCSLAYPRKRLVEPMPVNGVEADSGRC